MNLKTNEAGQPEQQNSIEQTADNQQVSPSGRRDGIAIGQPKQMLINNLKVE